MVTEELKVQCYLINNSSLIIVSYFKSNGLSSVIKQFVTVSTDHSQSGKKTRPRNSFFSLIMVIKGPKSQENLDLAELGLVETANFILFIYQLCKNESGI